MRYIRNGGITEDDWIKLSEDDPLPADGRIIVPAARLLGSDAALQAWSGPLGVIWPNNRPVADLAPHLKRLSLVALVFPIFRDGRAYTQARQLREDYGFRGELRATGNVLRDQFVLMLRAGFDAFEVQKDRDAEAFETATRAYSRFYQPGADGQPGVLRQRLMQLAD